MGIPGKCFPTVVCFWDWLGPDKIVHFILFGLLAFLLLWGYRKKTVSENTLCLKKRFILTLIISIAYGGLTEILQKHVFINRYGSLYDFIADAIGCVIGVLAFNFYLKFFLKK